MHLSKVSIYKKYLIKITITQIVILKLKLTRKANRKSVKFLTLYLEIYSLL
jgi:hypothetical protein